MTVRVERRVQHALPLDEAVRRAAHLARGLLTEFQPESRWYGSRLVFHVTSGLMVGVGGFVDVSPAEVHVLVDLPGFLGAMFKPMVEKTIDEKLAEMLR